MNDQAAFTNITDLKSKLSPKQLSKCGRFCNLYDPSTKKSTLAIMQFSTPSKLKSIRQKVSKAQCDVHCDKSNQ